MVEFNFIVTHGIEPIITEQYETERRLAQPRTPPPAYPWGNCRQYSYRAIAVAVATLWLCGRP